MAAAILLAGIIYVVLVPSFFALSELPSNDTTIKAAQAINLVLLIVLIALYLIPKLRASRFCD